ncbi:MAG: histidine kinase dimerization/phospho-acceptor domain-containing protein, partial [Reyranella sp.]|nr:histidine kinase dimerization/phospho-acceptor domain-containing protein [Reyranella sp.]
MKAPAFLRRGGLFAKYFLSLVGIVTLVLLINGAFDMWFAYGTARQALGRLQQEQANGAADKVGQFITEIERQIGWTTHPQWAAAPVDQRRFDFIRLQRQVPAITELTQIDGQGREQLKVSRLAMDAVGTNTDLSKDPRFTEVQDKRVWYSPVYLRKESEPYMTISLARTGRRAGATAAEVNLKLIWDVVSAIKAGDKGYAYVVDRDGRLIAHPDISLVLRNTNMSKLEQVHTALDDLRDGKPLTGASARFGKALDGTPVLSSVAAIPALGWLVFVEQPTSEALQPLFTSLWQTLALLVLGLATAALGAWFLSRRMASPIRILSTGAERLGSGDFDHRIEIKTGDEVEALATNFNRMAGQLQESHATLEQRVVDRTRELTETLEQQTATAEILQVISRSPTDTQPVFDAIAESAMRLLDGWSVLVWRYDGERMRVIAGHGGLPGSDVASVHAALGEQRPEDLAYPGEAILKRTILQIADVEADGVEPRVREVAHARGWRANIAVPMLRDDASVGLITVSRKNPGAFDEREIRLLQTFADQAVIAIENVRLFTEIQDKSRQLEIASQHKSQFLANMSHELRTPLNAIIGYTEMMADGLYGEVGEKAAGVLERVQNNGRHLLGLINDVLDLSKIEAGQLTLTVEPYSVADMVATVLSATESLARTKGIALGSAVAPGLPTGTGDARRLTQVLLNLVGNAIKFTDQGSVEV